MRLVGLPRGGSSSGAVQSKRCRTKRLRGDGWCMTGHLRLRALGVVPSVVSFVQQAPTDACGRCFRLPALPPPRRNQASGAMLDGVEFLICVVGTSKDCVNSSHWPHQLEYNIKCR